MRSVAVLGATGALGKATVDELINKNISVKILVRDIEEYKALYPQQKFPGRINVVQGDLDTNQSIANVMENVDILINDGIVVTGDEKNRIFSGCCPYNIGFNG